MDGATIGNRQQPRTLFVVQHAFEFDVSFNEREPSRARFAIGTIFSVDARMTEANRVAFQNEASVPPGGVGTFVFKVRAPMTPGVYAINLRPVIDAVTWMEDQGVFLYVTVVP